MIITTRLEMTFVPRRRSLYLKVLLLIPAAWLLITILINFNEKAKSNFNGFDHVPQSLQGNKEFFEHSLKEVEYRDDPKSVSKIVDFKKVN